MPSLPCCSTPDGTRHEVWLNNRFGLIFGLKEWYDAHLPWTGGVFSLEPTDQPVLFALTEVAAYAASKAAVASLTKSLAVEWARYGVCVNALVPGVFRTALNAEMLDGTGRGRECLMRTPMGRFGDLEELVGAAVFLASDAASFVTGHLLVVDGGFLASGTNQ